MSEHFHVFESSVPAEYYAYTKKVLESWVASGYQIVEVFLKDGEFFIDIWNPGIAGKKLRYRVEPTMPSVRFYADI